MSSLTGLAMSEPNAIPRFRLLPDRRRLAAARRKVERDLCQAVQRHEFVLHFQPRYCLASGLVAGMEAVVRWPNRRQASGALVPVAEQAGSNALLDDWMLNEACRAAAAWPAGEVVVSVKVSPRPVARLAEGHGLLEQVACALDRSGLAADRLELRLAESALLESSLDTLLMLSALRDLGVSLALDGFGTGCASLSLLKRLPLTAMKLDRTLVQDVPQQRDDAAIVRAAIDTAHALGLAVVADGVELEEQRAFLAGIGCDEGQGSLLGQKLSPEQACAVLHER